MYLLIHRSVIHRSVGDNECGLDSALSGESHGSPPEEELHQATTQGCYPNTYFSGWTRVHPWLSSWHTSFLCHGVKNLLTPSFQRVWHCKISWGVQGGTQQSAHLNFSSPRLFGLKEMKICPLVYFPDLLLVAQGSSVDAVGSGEKKELS